MKEILARIIGPLILVIIAIASLVLAVIGFFIFWYILIFAIAIGIILFLIGWLRYKITGQKSSNFEQILKQARQKANARRHGSKRKDYSKNKDSDKETINHDEIK